MFKSKLLKEAAEVVSPVNIRCTQATLEAYGVRGLRPATAQGVIEALEGHNYTLTPVEVKGQTVARFIQEHPKGDFYLGTQNHAMALRNGVLTDTAGEGVNNRLLIHAMEVE